jgi:putative ABC transport system permease protein
MNKMIVANLTNRPLRSIISITAVAVEVTLILLIVGLALGILDDNKTRQKGTGADILVRPPGSSNFTGLSSAPVSIKVGDVLRKQPHVTAVAPVVLQTTNKLETITGIDLQTYESLGGPLQYLKGGPFKAPDEVIVDDIYASARKVKVGSVVQLLGHDFRVTGIVPHGRGGRAYIPIKTMQELIGAENKATMFYVKLDNPDNADLMSEEIKKIPGMENYNVMPMRQWLTLMSPDNVPGLSIFIKVVIGIAMVIGFIVIFQAMYTSVMERTREIGILKSLGASKSYIVRLILRESALLGVAGVVVGIVISVAGRAGLVHQFPTLSVLPLTLRWAVYATLIAVGGAMLGAVYPAFKAAQKDPIDALAYE